MQEINPLFRGRKMATGHVMSAAKARAIEGASSKIKALEATAKSGTTQVPRDCEQVRAGRGEASLVMTVRLVDRTRLHGLESPRQKQIMSLSSIKNECNPNFCPVRWR